MGLPVTARGNLEALTTAPTSTTRWDRKTEQSVGKVNGSEAVLTAGRTQKFEWSANGWAMAEVGAT